MISVCLTPLVVTSPVKIADEPVSIQADRTNEMLWLIVGLIRPQLEHDTVLSRSKELVSGLFTLEIVGLSEFSGERAKRFTKLHIHQVCGGQLRCKAVEQLARLAAVWGLSRREQALDCFNSRNRFACSSKGGGGKSKNFIDWPQVHFLLPQQIAIQCNDTACISSPASGIGGVIQRLR